MSVNPRISKTINNYYCNSIEFDGGVNTYLYANANSLRFVDEEGLVYEWSELGLSECQPGIYYLYGDKVEIAKCKNNIAFPIPYYSDIIVDENLAKTTKVSWYTPEPIKIFARAIWINRVKPKGIWDYKRIWHDPKYQDLGNFNYGATGNKVGFYLFELMGAGGIIATLKGQHNSGPFNDQHVDQFWVEQGYRYYENNY